MGGAGGTATPCYTTTFTAPTSGATLTVADDSDQSCANGFQYTVKITSNAPDGTDVTLYDGTTLLKTVQVSGQTASFAVQLATGGTAQQLSIQYPSTATCNVSENVTVTCPNTPPTCTISAPVISATHPDLNGVQAPAGDRSSSPGSLYQATFVVSTSAEDGQTVTLAVDNAAAPGTPVDGTPTATVSGGSATFGLTLVPDGTYEVSASCLNKNGITGTSTKSSFTVDTTPPDLTVNSPSSGQFLIGAVNVCAQTDSADAASLASSLGAAQNNLCVTLGSSATPACAKVLAINTATCVSFPCPGSAPFGLTIVLNDAAGNPTTQTLTGVTCASSLPSVQIVAPASDAPAFTDSSKHILAANAPVGVKDEDGTTPGAQADVVACTDTAGTAMLFGGHKGDASLSQIGVPITTAAAVAADNCPSGLGFVAHFTGVTLPESNENADGTLSAATELTVNVTSTANSADTGTSLPDDVWVDSIAPALTLQSPAGLCGSFTQSAATVTEDVVYTADDKLVVADVTNNGVTTTYDTPAFVNGIATFGSVAFKVGQNDLVTAESDPAGNATVLATCTVTIGAAPVVTFTTPTAGALLCPSTAIDPSCIDDNDTGTPGWQGSLAVHVTANSGAAVVGSTVTFSDSTSGTTYGGAITDAGGNAQFNAATVPEGTQTLVATTDNVPGAGVGSGSVTVNVDTAAPNAPTGLDVEIPLPTVDPTARRKVLMKVTWTAPSDSGGGNVAGYQIRYAKVPIDATNFNNAAVTTAVAYTGTPATAGQIDGINVSPLYIESNYYFAIEAVDVAGSVSPILASAPTGSCTCGGNCCASHFLSTTLTGATGDRLGTDLDGSGDFGQPAGSSFTKDGLSDLLVAGQGSNKDAFLYLASSTGYSSSPSVTFTGSAAQFGSAIVDAGDIDGDGLDDIAIAARLDGAGKVYIYSRHNPPASWGTTTSWPAALTDTQANYVITATSPLTAGSMDVLNLARLGNFDGAGADDLAVSFDGANGFDGAVFIVKGSTSFASLSIPNATNALEIDGAAGVGSALGATVLGIGPFFQPTGGPGLLTGAILTSTVYAFQGQSTAGPLSVSAANDSAATAAVALYGNTLGLLGPFGGSPAAISIGAPGAQYVDVNLGTSSTGPIVGPIGGAPQPTIHFVDGAAGNSFGALNVGGAVRGTSQTLSLIGPTDSNPDLILAGQAEIGRPIYIVDGAAMLSMSGTIDVSTFASSSAIIKLANIIPSNWAGYSTGTIIPDSNGDGAADFAVGESVVSGGAGRVIILY